MKNNYKLTAMIVAMLMLGTAHEAKAFNGGGMRFAAINRGGNGFGEARQIRQANNGFSNVRFNRGNDGFANAGFNGGFNRGALANVVSHAGLQNPGRFASQQAGEIGNAVGSLNNISTIGQ